MPEVLYRKYRSQTFSQIFGQQAIVKVLRESVKSNKISHAYLFTGPRGTGKTSMARILAKAVNCKNPNNGDPCNDCSSCIGINESRHMDLVEIDAASNRGIDEIRDLKEKVGFLPVEGKYKVYIIDEVHMLTSEAFNALLKTLEEPPERVIFILATTEVHKLPMTILSRVQRYDFKLAKQDELKGKLEKILIEEGIKFEAGAIDIVVNAGQGSFRDSESILEKVLSAQGYKKDKVINKLDVEEALGFASSEVIQGIVDAIKDKNIQNAMEILADAESRGVNLAQLLKQILEYARLQFVDAIKNRQQTNIIFFGKLIKEFINASNDMRFAPIQSLPIELAMLNLSDVATQAPATIDNRVIEKKVDESKTIKSLDETEYQKKEVKRTVKSEEVKSEPAQTEVVKEQSVSPKEVTDPRVNLQRIKNDWPVILKEAKPFNHHLVAFLSKAQITGIEGDCVLVDVPFNIQKKTLEQKRSQEIFSEVTQKIVGAPLRLICSVNKELAQPIDDSIQLNSNKDLVEEVFSDI